MQENESHLIGFKNFGSTCYINSCIQCLLSCNSFIKNIKITVENSEKCNDVVNQLYDCFGKVMMAQKGKILEPKKLIKTIFKQSNMMFSNSETDSHEFLTWLLDEVCKSSYEQCKIITRGTFKITIECNCCNITKVIHEAFSSIILGIPNDVDNVQHLNSLIRNELKTEHLNERLCEHCNKMKPATKSISIKEIPHVLIFAIKKYDYSKIIKIDEFLKLKHTIYELRSISCYTGNFDCGHYYSIVKQNECKYFVVDDEIITPIQFSQINLSHIYMLFYNRISSDDKRAFS